MVSLFLWIPACWYGCGQPAAPAAEATPAPHRAGYEQLPYPHFSDFLLYSHEIGVEEKALADTIFVIPLNSCEECVRKLLGMLSHNCARPYTVIVSDKNEKIDPKPYLDGCTRPMVWDTGAVLHTYRLEITGPAVLLRKGSQTEVIHLSSENLADVHSAFRWE